MRYCDYGEIRSPYAKSFENAFLALILSNVVNLTFCMESSSPSISKEILVMKWVERLIEHLQRKIEVDPTASRKTLCIFRNGLTIMILAS